LHLHTKTRQQRLLEFKKQQHFAQYGAHAILMTNWLFFQQDEILPEKVVKTGLNHRMLLHHRLNLYPDHTSWHVRGS
jgi:hypothetical protein